MKKCYIDNNITKGLLYDYALIEREYKKLKTPAGLYAPPFSALSRNKYFIGLSDRSTGKTTNWLLFGLVMNKLYGTVIQYVRATENELSPSHAEKLVDVIKEYDDGYYIKELTGGEYNSVYYHWKQFFYCYIDENGNRTATSDRPIIQCLSIERAGDYKSTYNAPLGDLIILDEFIGKYYRPNECVQFLDLTKTIIRDRQSPIIVMLANTINLSSHYFEEMEISRDVLGMKKGEMRAVTTAKGTHIFIEIIDASITKSEQRQAVNRLFFGFKNPKLNAITGEGLYAFDSVPHIPPRNESYYVIQNNIYFETGIDLLQCEYAYNDELGYHFEIHRANKTYDDSVILSLEVKEERRYLYGFGTKRLQGIFGRFLSERKVFFSSNEIGTIFNDYLRRYQAMKRL